MLCTSLGVPGRGCGVVGSFVLPDLHPRDSSTQVLEREQALTSCQHQLDLTRDNLGLQLRAADEKLEAKAQQVSIGRVREIRQKISDTIREYVPKWLLKRTPCGQSVVVVVLAVVTSVPSFGRNMPRGARWCDAVQRPTVTKRNMLCR